MWPDLQRLEREGFKLWQLQAWLADRGIKVGLTSVKRCMDRIHAATPPAEPAPKPAPPALEPANDEDELRDMRTFARSEMLGGDWKQRHSAVRLILSLRAEKRASAPSPKPGTQSVIQPSPEQQLAQPTRSQAELDAIAQRDLN